jgi:hypothetical protein
MDLINQIDHFETAPPFHLQDHFAHPPNIDPGATARLVYFVYLVCLVKSDLQNETNQIN